MQLESAGLMPRIRTVVRVPSPESAYESEVVAEFWDDRTLVDIFEVLIYGAGEQYISMDGLDAWLRTTMERILSDRGDRG